ncbi:MAG: hypothetical protein M0R18_15450, partial [Deltaproteobacteria bacterium]|nr:hypothetical protein [Deltaproteobacteria bacterium]
MFTIYFPVRGAILDFDLLINPAISQGASADRRQYSYLRDGPFVVAGIRPEASNPLPVRPVSPTGPKVIDPGDKTPSCLRSMKRSSLPVGTGASGRAS